MQVYEVVRQYKTELEQLRRENASLRESEKLANEKYKRERNEMGTLQKIMADREEDYGRRQETMTIRN